MSYVTVEVEIEQGRIVAREPEKLPQKESGLLTILPVPNSADTTHPPTRRRVELPLIRGDGQHIINPTPQELGQADERSKGGLVERAFRIGDSFSRLHSIHVTGP